MSLTKQAETICSTQRLTLDEARKLIAMARERGWISTRSDAFALPSLKKADRPLHRGKPMGRFDPLP